MGPLTNITYYIPHIIQLKFSTKYAYHITTKIGPQITLYPTQSPTSFGLWAKLKESPNSKSPITMWLIQKSHYDVANSKYPTTMWQIKNIPLRHGKFKARYDAALFTNPATKRHYLQSPLLHVTLKPVATRQ